MDVNEDVTEEMTASVPAAGRRFRYGICVLAMMVLLPSAVTVTGIGLRGLNWFCPRIAAVTRFEHLSLHWWAPIECTGLQIDNTRERSQTVPPLLTVRRLTTRQSLWQIGWNFGRGIDVILTEPELNLVNTIDGSNLRDAIEDLGGEQDSSGNTVPFRIAVHNGRINVVRTDSSVWTSEDRITAKDHAAYTVDRLVSDIHCEVSTLQADGLFPDISLVASIGRDRTGFIGARERFPASGTTVNPRIAARLEQLTAGFHPLQLDTPDGESQRSERPTVEIKLCTVSNKTHRALRFVARELDLEELEPLIVQLIPGVRCRGLVSVQGEAVMNGTSPVDGIALRGAVRAADVVWRQATWHSEEAVVMSTASADCAIAVADDGIIVQTLSAKCPFASLNGSGEIRLPADQLPKSIIGTSSWLTNDRRPFLTETAAAPAGQVNIRGLVDLVKLSQMLPRTMQLREGLRLQEGSLRFAMQTEPRSAGVHDSEELDWQAVLESSPIVAIHNQRTIRWDSPVRLMCSGPLGMAQTQLTSATLSADFGRLQVKPVSNTLHLHGRVDVNRLWSHLGQFIDSRKPGVQGELQIDAAVGIPLSSGFMVRNLSILGDNLRIESPKLGICLDESLLKMLDGQLTVNGTGAAVRSLVGPWTELSWLARDSRVFAQLDAAPSQRLTIIGEIRPGPTASVSSDFGAGSSMTPFNQARLTLDIDTDTQADHYVIRNGRLRAPGIDAQLSGTLESTGEWMTTQLVVDAEYDLAALSRTAFGDSGGDLRLTGQKQTRFVVRGTPAFWDGSGPADAPKFEVTGELGWDAADAYGLKLGPVQIPVRLKNGEIETETVRCSVNGGQLTTMINYDLRQSHLALASGSRVENITVSNELAGQWLGYVAPFLSEATDVQGAVSARLSHCHLTAGRPEAAELGGVITVHEISARPGRSLKTLLQTLNTVRSDRRSLQRDLVIPAQQIPFELRNGMITHDQFVVGLSGFELKSRGTIGLNQQLRLIVDVPLERSGDRQSARSVSIPVRGTVTQPSIDLSRVVYDAGTQRIHGEINRQLDRLFNRLR
ncbi:MAG: hypothetical protein MK110_05465 [Fuerstiella sp.]|nr:hypothetical protein [Fuerstiella sp.]